MQIYIGAIFHQIVFHIDFTAKHRQKLVCLYIALKLADADPSDFLTASVSISILLASPKLKYTSSGRQKSDYFTLLTLD